jgi:8-oxo-dGTP pyrophosphatase MutT (NUDIX family)
MQQADGGRGRGRGGGGGARGGSRATFGCVAFCVRPDAGPCVLLARLRWTRSGFKSLVHALTGANPVPASDAPFRCCTDHELALLAGPFELLWGHELLPPTWRAHCSAATAADAHAHWGARRAAAELQRRATGGAWEPDELSAQPLVLPKGGAEPGESDADAALREFSEETGVPLLDVRLAPHAPLRCAGLCAFAVALEPRFAQQAAWSLQHCCETCAAAGAPASLCEACAEAHGAGRPGVHAAGHALTPHRPVSSRLAAAGAAGDAAASAANPWGAFGAAVSARSRQRLKERTGL